jgi:hypothetical protein
MTESERERATVRDEPGTTTQTKLLAHSRLETLLLRAAAYIALLGALLLLVGSLLTWVTVRFAFAMDAFQEGGFAAPIMGWSGLLGLIDQTPFIRLARLTLFLWDVFPLTGLLLCLLLLRQQRIARGLLAVYGAWLLATTVTCALIFNYALTFSNPFPCAPGNPLCPETRVLSRTIEVGGWLTLSSLALAWLALGLLIQRRRATVAVTETGATTTVAATLSIRYTPSHRLGAAIFTVGAVVWASGLLAVPWATSGCTGLHLSFNHFARGTCSGVDGYDVLTAGLTSLHQNGVISWPMIEVAGVVGLFAVITVWLPRLKRVTWVTALTWSLLAALFFAVGAIGVRATIAFPPVFTADAHDPWMGSYGVSICALGIAGCWVGVAALARGEIAQTRRSSRH